MRVTGYIRDIKVLNSGVQTAIIVNDTKIFILA